MGAFDGSRGIGPWRSKNGGCGGREGEKRGSGRRIGERKGREKEG